MILHVEHWQMYSANPVTFEALDDKAVDGRPLKVATYNIFHLLFRDLPEIVCHGLQKVVACRPGTHGDVDKAVQVLVALNTHTALVSVEAALVSGLSELG